MERLYQVFVSSTFTDLQEERRRVMEVLLNANCVPAGMELFPASGQDQLDMIKPIIDRSDYYLIIVGARYGSPSSRGISFTEREYRHAVEHGKHILGFVHEDPASLPFNRSEPDPSVRERLQRFRASVMEGRMVSLYRNPEDLATKVLASIGQAKSQFPQEGWVRGREVTMLERKVAELESQLLTAQHGPAAAPTPAQLPAELTERYVFPARMGYLRRVADPDTQRQVARKNVMIPTTWGQVLSYTGTAFMHEEDYLWLMSPLCELAQSVIEEDDSYLPDDFASFNGGAIIDNHVIDAVLAKLISIGVTEPVEREGPFITRHFRLTDLGLACYATVMR